MWPKELVMVRHAESQGNVMDVTQRAETDVATHAYPLTPFGREQAYETGRWLHRNYGTFDTYYTSYYERARETMRLMYPEAKVYEDPRLAEAQRGIYHVLTQMELMRHCPYELKRKEREGLYHYRPPGGENWADIELRIHSFLGTLSRDYGGKRVLIVVHGHWLLQFQRLVERFSIEECVRRYEEKKIFNNASVTAYRGASAFGALNWIRSLVGIGRYVRLSPVCFNFTPWDNEQWKQQHKELMTDPKSE
jgi:broad specificity phosphatase PhoE